MEYTVLVLALVALATANDLKLGHEGGKIIYSQQFDASPAIWRQVNTVKIDAKDNEVIRQIIIKDLREEKDGEARIVDGGVGVKDVTVELKSPTVLRGYSFKVEVYAAATDGNEQGTTESYNKDSSNIPGVIGKDGKQNKRDIATTPRIIDEDGEPKTDAAMTPGILSQDEEKNQTDTAMAPGVFTKDEEQKTDAAITPKTLDRNGEKNQANAAMTPGIISNDVQQNPTDAEQNKTVAAVTPGILDKDEQDHKTVASTQLSDVQTSEYSTTESGLKITEGNLRYIRESQNSTEENDENETSTTIFKETATEEVLIALGDLEDGDNSTTNMDQINSTSPTKLENSTGDPSVHIVGFSGRLYTNKPSDDLESSTENVRLFTDEAEMDQTTMHYDLIHDILIR